MPVRSRSLRSRPAMYWRALALASLSWSISGEKPGRMTLPSPTAPDGSGRIAASIRPVTSGAGGKSDWSQCKPKSVMRWRSSGSASRPVLRANSSRGATVPAVTRPIMRSRSGTSDRAAAVAARVMPSR